MITKNLSSSKWRCTLSSPFPLNFSSTKLREKHKRRANKCDLASTYYQISKDFIQDSGARNKPKAQWDCDYVETTK
ncbi:hypothetical protein TorRG33x02_009730 [Trema orientale]|uniref:Uncharacterized protein n=1 Tax=Trema orientale TaxID=63057 RepID=A0A2P5FYP0_TREOI|nr:hypothetical protein TorRG33x02_009730 [Trema orientale]